ncbi:MAG TPA: BNR-4 repeat-containing protein, partial [Armatimonadota bacterium]|nr:BNR-4 repeat-containing protein [Armatimonadota bacterium]
PPAECRGVWYQCGKANLLPGQGAVYSGPMATYCVWHRPMAIFRPEVNRSFFVYGNADNSPTISFYDHASGSFAYPVVLGSNPDGDAHRNPTLLIDEAGYLHVFYGAHGHQTHVLRSERPWDITAWAEAAQIEDPGTSYPQPWQLLPGEIFVSYRQAPGWRFRMSADGARSWRDPVDIVNFGCPDDARGCAECSIYGITVAEGGDYPRRLHFAWSRLGGGTPEEIESKHLWARRYNVYYACSDDGGSTWKRSDGSRYELPINEEQAEKIWDCGQRGIWLTDIQVDSRGNPYILFLDSRVETFEARWMVARRVPDGWAFTEVTRSDHMYDAGALIAIADDDLRIWGPTTDVQPHEDGGDIDEWCSTDGGATWELARHLTSGSRYSHNHVKPVMGHQLGTGDLRAIWNYGDSMSPPETRDVRLYFYGEKQHGPREIPFPAGPDSQEA